ncbi:MAG: 4'-phosphopantetheinyl transferase superfamily protein [Gammaproteobacteria bacterium]|nr:4'-phosphopantetheinyl transferase superfamily protein [Gammaproteobacteria bacterium]
MNNCFSIKKNDVHIWWAFLPSFISQIDRFLTLLSPDELERIARLRFEKHRERFIITRAVLRQILSCYIKTSAEKILFSYTPQGKPYLTLNSIYFNTSHSHDIAVYGFSGNNEIGIDVEKIEPTFNIKVAKRFFSKEEYQYLLNAPDREKNKIFYTLWSRKEALVKTIGSGLYTPLNAFSCLLQEKSSHVFLREKDKEWNFHMEDFNVHPDYHSAFAVKPPVTNISVWEWQDHGPVAWQ